MGEGRWKRERRKREENQYFLYFLVYTVVTEKMAGLIAPIAAKILFENCIGFLGWVFKKIAAESGKADY